MLNLIAFQKNQLVRWDRTGNLDSPNTITELQLYNQYIPVRISLSSIYLISKSCWSTCTILKLELVRRIFFQFDVSFIRYGPDAYQPWCFGEAESMDYVGEITVGTTQCNLWNNNSNGFTWVSSIAQCLPISTQHSNDMIVFYNTTLGIKVQVEYVL